jgi:hypothetical protein
MVQVNNHTLVVVLSLLAAVAFASSSSLKHVSAGHAPDAQNFALKKLGRFARATLSHPWWLAGLACDVVGLTLQIVALHLGDLSVVQPLLISGLVFALVLRQWLSHQRITVRELSWIAVLVVALAGFLFVATAGQSSVVADTDRLPAAVSGAIGLVLSGTCIELGRRQRKSGRTAALLGVAVGIVYAADAAVLKGLTDIGTRHLPDILVSWQLYAVVALGCAGLFLNQLAFQAGPLVASLPATATVDPLLSIVVGVLVYDERVRLGPGHGFLLVVMLLVLGAAIIELARDVALPLEATRDR